jgi:hypothetical protein
MIDNAILLFLCAAVTFGGIVGAFVGAFLTNKSRDRALVDRRLK